MKFDQIIIILKQLVSRLSVLSREYESWYEYKNIDGNFFLESSCKCNIFVKIVNICFDDIC